MKASFGTIFANRSGEQAQVREDRAERNVQATLDEEERRQEGEGDDAEALLLFRCSA